MNILLTNIKLLINTRKQNQLLRGAELADLPCIEDAFLANHSIYLFCKKV